MTGALAVCAITSQNGTAPKPQGFRGFRAWVRLPVRTALLQNGFSRSIASWAVRLPVRTALLQNLNHLNVDLFKCDYQSERHCSKTYPPRLRPPPWCDYQSERHCSKTTMSSTVHPWWCDYQSERHCSKTSMASRLVSMPCDYQSERHCSKTATIKRMTKEVCDYQSERHCSKTHPPTPRPSP